MRRKDREVTDFAEIVRIIDQCAIVRIGLADGDFPYIVPVNFAKGKCLFMTAAKKKPDRRYQRTHELIINKAVELAAINGWEKVSVAKLADTANLNRNSFYIHFSSINDVFEEIEKDFVNKYHELLNTTAPLDAMLKDKAFFEAFCSLLENEKASAAVIAKIGRADHLLFKLQKEWTEVFAAALADSEGCAKDDNTILPYISGSMYTFFSRWLKDPYGFDVRKNSLFSAEAIDSLLKYAAKEKQHAGADTA